MLPDTEENRAYEYLNILRGLGWSLAVHNDYKLNGEFHTFYLFTKDNTFSVKGEGKTDLEALKEVRDEILRRNLLSNKEKSFVKIVIFVKIELNYDNKFQVIEPTGSSSGTPMLCATCLTENAARIEIQNRYGKYNIMEVIPSDFDIKKGVLAIFVQKDK